MAKNNKVKFGLCNVHYAKILSWSEDGIPTYATPVSVPGAVNLSVDPSGEQENFFADNIVYYVINNNSGYDGDLEIALIPVIFAIDILGEKLDNNGLLVENINAETSEFALFWEFDGDQHHIRHVAYRCSASRAGMTGKTNEDTKTPQTDTLSIKMMALPNGFVKSKTVASTNQTIYDEWYKSVHLPVFTEIPSTTKSKSS